MEYKALTTLGLITYNLLRASWDNAKELDREAAEFGEKALVEVIRDRIRLQAKNTPKQAQGQFQKRGRGRPKKEGRIEIAKTSIPGPVLYALSRYAENKHILPIKYVDQMSKVKAGELVKYKGVGWASIVKTSKILQQHGINFADAPNT